MYSGSQGRGLDVRNMASIDSKEIELISQFRQRVADLNLKGRFLDDHDLVRWIRARNHDLDQAEKMIRESMKWREVNDIDNILTWNPPPRFLKELPMEFLGYDDENSPIMVLPYGKKKPNGDPVTQYVIIVDHKGLAYRTLASVGAVDMSLQAVRSFEANQPETVKAMYQINANMVFAALFALIKPLMSANTQEIELIAQLRKNVSDLNLSEKFNTDHFLVRWIRARQHYLVQAEKMLRQHINWRKENDLDNISSWIEPEELLKGAPIELLGFDDDNSPVLFLPIGSWDIKKMLEGMSYWNVLNWRAMDIRRQILRTFEANLPETIKAVYVINCKARGAPILSFEKRFNHLLGANLLSASDIFNMDRNSIFLIRNLSQQLSDTRTEIQDAVFRLTSLTNKLNATGLLLGTLEIRLGDIERELDAALELTPGQDSSSVLTTQELSNLSFNCSSSSRTPIGHDEISSDSTYESSVEMESEVSTLLTSGYVEQQQSDQSTEQGSVSGTNTSFNSENCSPEKNSTCNLTSLSIDESFASSERSSGEETIVGGDPAFWGRISLNSSKGLKGVNTFGLSDLTLSPELTPPCASSTVIQIVSSEAVKSPGKRYGRFDDHCGTKVLRAALEDSLLWASELNIGSEIQFRYKINREMETIRGKVLFIGKHLIKVESGNQRPRLFIKQRMENVELIRER
ncbi:unnamed protein product [Allacma fusca]|uniref:CRAL-TRIO domain-containing protein n=1 Tax=Allacma fusca TaxID=39272 RepID=A0A8J2J1M4_9HEXA|nr:unnamed protein product [Allacma fusca]